MLFPGHAKSLGIEDPCIETGSNPELGRQDHNGSAREGHLKGLGPKKMEPHQRHPHSNIFDDIGTPASRSLYVAGVPPSVTGRILREIFDPFGKIDSTNPTGDNFSKGHFGYVNFENIENAITARKHFNGLRIFENCTSPVIIRFDKHDRNGDSRKSDKSSFGYGKSTSPKDRIDEWFRPRSRERSVSDGQRRTSTEFPKDRVLGRPNVSNGNNWPNGLPPTGPRPRRTEISPPPLRRADTYRPHQDNTGAKSYRHDLEGSDLDRRSEEEYFSGTKHRERQSAYRDYERELNHAKNRNGHTNGPDHQLGHADSATRRFRGSVVWMREPPASMQRAAAPESRQPSDFLSSPRSPRVTPALSPSRPHEEDDIEPGEILLFTSTEPEFIRQTPRSPAASTSTDDDSDDAGYSPKYNPSSPTLGAVKVSSKPASFLISSPVVQTGGESEADAELESANRRPLTLGLGPTRRNKALNDETSSMISDLTTSDRTGVSNASSVRKNRCFRCPAKPTELAPIFKCTKCKRRYHKTPECLTAPGYPAPKKGGFLCDCGNKELEVESVTSAWRSPLLHLPTNTVKSASPLLSRFLDGGLEFQQSEPAISTGVLPEPSTNLESLGLSGPAYLPRPTISFTSPESIDLTRLAQVPKSTSLPQVVKAKERSGVQLLPVVKEPRTAEERPTVEEPPMAKKPLQQSNLSSHFSEKLHSPQTTPQALATTQLHERTISNTSHGKIFDAPTTTNLNTSDLPPVRPWHDFNTITQHDSSGETKISLNNVENRSWEFDEGILTENSSTKAYTCYWWKSREGCRFSAEVCRYAHFDTGLMTPRPIMTQGKDSGKPLTCYYFWKVGYCHKTDNDCRFAHYDTGVYADEPSNRYKKALDSSKLPSDLPPRSLQSFNHSAVSPDARNSSTSPEQPRRYSTSEFYSPPSQKANRVSVASLSHAGDPISVESSQAQISATRPESTEGHDGSHDGGLKSPVALRHPFPINGLNLRGGNGRALGDQGRETNTFKTPTNKQSDADAPSAELVMEATVTGNSLEPREDHDKAGPSSNLPQLLSSVLSASESQSMNSTKTAKRSGFVRDPRRRATEGTQQNVTSLVTGRLSQTGDVRPILDLGTSLMSPNTLGVQPTKKYNKCRLCSKQIFGSSMLCKVCEKTKETIGMQDPTSPTISEFSDISRSREPMSTISSPRKQLESISGTSEFAKGLKRPAPEGLMFISNKKPRLKVLPNQVNIIQKEFEIFGPNLAAPAVSEPQAQVNLTTNITPGRIAPTIQELVEIEQLKKENAELKAQIQAAQAKQTSVLSSTKEILSPAPELEPQELLHSPSRQQETRSEGRNDAKVNGLKGISSDSGPLFSTRSTPSIEFPHNTTASKSRIPVLQSSDIDDEEIGPNGQPAHCRVACKCHNRRRRCLHNENNELDPEKCERYLIDIKHKRGSHSLSEWSKIEAAAILAKAAISDSRSGSEETFSDFLESEDELMQESEAQITFPVNTISTPPPKSKPMTRKPNDMVQQKTSTLITSAKRAPWSNKDERAAIARLKKSGVVFESDSDSESGGSAHNYGPNGKILPRPQYLPLKAPKTSKDLFEIAPEYLPTNDDESRVSTALARGLGRKERNQNLLSKQCAERREENGNPHWEVDRTAAIEHAARTIKTVEERRMLPFKSGNAARTNGDEYDIHTAPAKLVEISFEQFLGFPEQPVACLVGQSVADTWGRDLKSRDRGKGLGFRDGAKDRPGWSTATRKMGRARVPDEEKWPVGAKG